VKAIVAARFGEPAEVLELNTLPDPPPGPSEVVVRVTKRVITRHHRHPVASEHGDCPLVASRSTAGGAGRITIRTKEI
jgi:NADPH:quinone reductase